MVVTINNIQDNCPENIKIEPIVNANSYGRKFKVTFSDNKQTITTMKELFESVNASKKTTEVDELKKLNAFLQKIENAEALAIVQYDNIAKKSCMFKLGSFFHRLFGGAFFGSHLERIGHLKHKFDQKLNPNAWKESKKFTDLVYKPLPTPQPFTGELLTKEGFKQLLFTHQAILDEFPANNHGTPQKNLERAFYLGYGYTTQGGEGPFFNDSSQNQQFHQKVKETLTLICRLEYKDQQIYMRKLGGAFAACNTERIRVITESHDELLGSSKATFEAILKLKINSYKIAHFDKMIWNKAPVQNKDTPMHLQITHLRSGYLAVVGVSLGLNGHQEAGLDSHKYNVSMLEKNSFTTEFKKTFDAQLSSFIEDIAREINDSSSNLCTSYAEWFNGKVMNDELPQEFGYYNEEKAKDKAYTNLKEPTDDQKGNLSIYISTNEVKQILGTLGYL